LCNGERSCKVGLMTPKDMLSISHCNLTRLSCTKLTVNVLLRRPTGLTFIRSNILVREGECKAEMGAYCVIRESAGRSAVGVRNLQSRLPSSDTVESMQFQ
jgi:hypothetical protein